MLQKHLEKTNRIERSSGITPFKISSSCSVYKNILTDDERKEAYQASAGERQTDYNVAVVGILNASHINTIDVSHYIDQPDSYIQVRAVDDFEV